MSANAVGIAGWIGSGKTAVAEGVAKSLDLPLLEVDHLGHDALRLKRDDIVGTFGEGICAADGSINRKALGQRVFGDSAALAQLNALVHPWMVDETRRRIEASAKPLLVVAALVWVMKLDAWMDRILFVSAPDDVLLARVAQRDGRSADQVRAILTMQKAQSNSKSPDAVVENLGALSDAVAAATAHIKAWIGSDHVESTGATSTSSGA